MPSHSAQPQVCCRVQTSFRMALVLPSQPSPAAKETGQSSRLCIRPQTVGQWWVLSMYMPRFPMSNTTVAGTLSWLNPSTGSAFYTAPIRNTNNSATVTADTSNTLFYNPSTFEITYAPSTTNTLAWTSYTPTWAADSGTVSIGNGQLTGSYKQIGKTVFFLLRIVLGSTSSVSGSTGWRLGLPITSVASPSVVANATYLQNGVAYYSGTANNEYNGSTTYVSPLCLVAAPVTGKLTQVNATTPFSWGTADTLTISGTYQSV